MADGDVRQMATRKEMLRIIILVKSFNAAKRDDNLIIFSNPEIHNTETINTRKINILQMRLYSGGF